MYKKIWSCSFVRHKFKRMCDGVVTCQFTVQIDGYRKSIRRQSHLTYGPPSRLRIEDGYTFESRVCWYHSGDVASALATGCRPDSWFSSICVSSDLAGMKYKKVPSMSFTDRLGWC